MGGDDHRCDGERRVQILTRVNLPLENLEFTIDSFLQENGSFLDRHTRAMLIGVRENVHRVALSARRLATDADAAPPATPVYTTEPAAPAFAAEPAGLGAGGVTAHAIAQSREVGPTGCLGCIDRAIQVIDCSAVGKRKGRPAPGAWRDNRMIVANLATYPARRANLPDVLGSIAPQVDRINVVLNEYTHVPPEICGFANVNGIIPDEDYKDVGKFYPDVGPAAFVFLIDDDIIYPPDYVAYSLKNLRASGAGRCAAGYYSSIYRRPHISLSRHVVKIYLGLAGSRLIAFRRLIHFLEACEAPMRVDQIGTGTAVLRAADYPPFAYMRGSERFVDVRFARWCHEQGISLFSLPRRKNWFRIIPTETSLYDSFTYESPRHVLKEIKAFAFKNGC